MCPCIHGNKSHIVMATSLTNTSLSNRVTMATNEALAMKTKCFISLGMNPSEDEQSLQECTISESIFRNKGEFCQICHERAATIAKRRKQTLYYILMINYILR